MYTANRKIDAAKTTEKMQRINSGWYSKCSINSPVFNIS